MALLRSVVMGVFAVTGIVTGAYAAYPFPGKVTGDTGIHDPTVVKTPEGTYLAAYTGPNILLKTSSDRTAWRNVGAAFPNGAPWTKTYTATNPDLWAPDLSYHNGTYYMYYAASSFGSQKSAIFLATSTTGASGSWADKGMVMESSNANDYNCIDPNLIVDADGKWWLNFGSYWSGIKMVALNPSTGKRSDNKVLSLAKRTEAGGAIEAPYITRHGNYYYLWVSFDKCCNGASSTYRVMVGRSSNVTGPYVDRNGRNMMSGGGTEVMATHGTIHGPGHESVFTDTDADVLVYHWYAEGGGSFLGINLIRYDSDWPVVY